METNRMTTQEFLQRLGKSLHAIAVRIVGICEYYSTNINNDGTFTIVAYQLENAEEIEIDVCFRAAYCKGEIIRIEIESFEMSDKYDEDNKDIGLRLEYYADELTQALININYKPNWSYYESK